MLQHTSTSNRPGDEISQIKSADVDWRLNQRNVGDSLKLLQSIDCDTVPLVVFDPQHRSSLARLQYGNEGVGRQRARAALPAMTDSYIDECHHQFARVLRPSGYAMVWADDYRLLQGYHLRFAEILKSVGLVSWDNQRMGMGYRTRSQGDTLVILQKPPLRAKSTWTDHAISTRWAEKVDRKLHPHIKPIGLIKRLIGATTQPDDTIIDPAAGSFVVMTAAHELGRNFLGCDIREI